MFFDNKSVYSSSNNSLTRDYIEHVNSDLVYFKKLLYSAGNKYFVLWPEKVDHASSKIYSKYNYGGGAHLLIESDSYIEFFWFCSDANNKFIQDFYIRQNKAVINFVKDFICENKSLLMENNIRNTCTCPDGINFSGLAKTKSVIKEDNNKIRNLSRLSKTNSVPSFSKQEYCCLELLARGRTMKEIGRVLRISPRTVESYVESIKNKIGCNFKSQILDTFYKNHFNA